MGHPFVVTVTQTCWACPVQYEGKLNDGRFFYFRYRFGVATLGVGSTPDDAAEDPAETRLAVGDNLRGTFEDDEERDRVFSRLLADRLRAEWQAR